MRISKLLSENPGKWNSQFLLRIKKTGVTLCTGFSICLTEISNAQNSRFIFNQGVLDGMNHDAVRQIVTPMSQLGPDAEGVWVSEGVVLGHRHLVILDLEVATTKTPWVRRWTRAVVERMATCE